MARPTEPGWYWLTELGEWSIVKVEEVEGAPIDNWMVFECGWEEYAHVSHYGTDQWGGKITQEPAPDPPPPF